MFNICYMMAATIDVHTLASACFSQLSHTTNNIQVAGAPCTLNLHFHVPCNSFTFLRRKYGTKKTMNAETFICSFHSILHIEFSEIAKNQKS